MTLQQDLRQLIEKHEDGENHDEGAFDPECPVCQALAKLRAIERSCQSSTQ